LLRDLPSYRYFLNLPLSLSNFFKTQINTHSYFLYIFLPFIFVLYILENCSSIVLSYALSSSPPSFVGLSISSTLFLTLTGHGEGWYFSSGKIFLFYGSASALILLACSCSLTSVNCTHVLACYSLHKRLQQYLWTSPWTATLFCPMYFHSCYLSPASYKVTSPLSLYTIPALAPFNIIFPLWGLLTVTHVSEITEMLTST